MVEFSEYVNVANRGLITERASDVVFHGTSQLTLLDILHSGKLKGRQITKDNWTFSVARSMNSSYFTVRNGRGSDMSAFIEFDGREINSRHRAEPIQNPHDVQFDLHRSGSQGSQEEEVVVFRKSEVDLKTLGPKRIIIILDRYVRDEGTEEDLEDLFSLSKYPIFYQKTLRGRPVKTTLNKMKELIDWDNWY